MSVFVKLVKYYKKMLFLVLLLPALSGRWLTPIFNITIAYLTPIYYYSMGKPLPDKMRKCLYEVYGDKELVDSMRYTINENFIPSWRQEEVSGICLGRLIVFNFDPFDEDLYELTGRSAVLHEVMHAIQMKRMGKPWFLAMMVYETIKHRSYMKTPIEQEAIEAEKLERLCEKEKQHECEPARR